MNILKRVFFILYLFCALVLFSLIAAYSGLRQLSGESLNFVENIVIIGIIGIYLITLLLYAKALGKKYLFLVILFFLSLGILNVTKHVIDFVNMKQASIIKNQKSTTAAAQLSTALTVRDITVSAIPKSTDKKVSFVLEVDVSKLPTNVMRYKINLSENAILMLSQELRITSTGLELLPLESKQQAFYEVTGTVEDDTIKYTFNYYPSQNPKITLLIESMEELSSSYQKEIPIPL